MCLLKTFKTDIRDMINNKYRNLKNVIISNENMIHFFLILKTRLCNVSLQNWKILLLNIINECSGIITTFIKN
jgi:hypothetical protein